MLDFIRFSYYRFLNVVENNWKMNEFTFNEDVIQIRNEAPHRGVRLTGDEPIKMSPGVYVFRGHTLDNYRERRYYCTVLGDRTVIELWR